MLRSWRRNIVPWDICPQNVLFILRKAQYWVNAMIQRGKYFGQHKQSSCQCIYMTEVPWLELPPSISLSRLFLTLHLKPQCWYRHRSSSKKFGWSTHSFVHVDGGNSGEAHSASMVESAASSSSIFPLRMAVSTTTTVLAPVILGYRHEFWLQLRWKVVVGLGVLMEKGWR